ncbi:trypsin-like serine protease [Candidatus Pacearchaeota archaeon]|nr:trypsin-like serine protease [Candidatus Pacearchaeota archaeon]
MKHHVNVLYGAVILLLIFQVISFISVSSQSAKLISRQNQFEEKITGSIEEIKQENQYRFGEVVKSISQQETAFENQIELLKNTQQDFSLIIESSVKKVVTIATDISAGTGFAVGQDGYILTNHHVISGSNIIQVQTYDDKIYTAELIGSDASKDLAVLKINYNMDGFELANSDEVVVGQKVIAIGNPLGLSFTVTEGIISAVQRVGPNGLKAYIQTDVTLNPGNSGGPLIDKSGKIIGMNNFKVGNAEALGFALESNVIKETANDIVGVNIVN